MSVDDAAFLSYNVLCVVASTLGVGGCVCQLVKRTPRCVGCLTTPNNALLLLVQNNIIACIATTDLLAVLGIQSIPRCSKRSLTFFLFRTHCLTFFILKIFSWFLIFKNVVKCKV